MKVAPTLLSDYQSYHDYHQSSNFVNFMKWFENSVICEP